MVVWNGFFMLNRLIFLPNNKALEEIIISSIIVIIISHCASL